MLISWNQKVCLLKDFFYFFFCISWFLRHFVVNLLFVIIFYFFVILYFLYGLRKIIFIYVVIFDKEVMMVVDIDKNIEWHILNLFLIICFNLRLIIFCLVENTTKPVYQLSSNSQKWSNYNGCMIRLMLEQVGGNAYY